MTISPDYAREVARRVRAHYQAAEDIVLERLVDAVAWGIDDDSWASRKAADLAKVLATIDRQLARMDEAAPALIEKAIAEAWQAGEAAAGAEMTAAGLEAIGGRTASRGVDVLAEDTVRVLADMRPRVVRAAADVYQRITADTAAQVLTGAQTRREAARTAVRRYAADGIAPFVDKGGRRWEMGAYAEMTTRTTAGQAAIAGHTDRLQALGQDLVIVSSSPESCDLCGPWEGKVLSISGDSRGRASDGTRIAGTVSRARGAGLQHPNCTHSLSAYLPGATRKTKADAAPRGYEAKQEQRRMERKVREWKRREQLALTPEAAAKSRRKVRQWQTSLRDHIDAHDLKRLRYREQVGQPGEPLAR